MKKNLGIIILLVSIAIFALYVYSTNRSATTSKEIDKTMANEQSTTTSALTLTSPSFENQGNIPSKFTCDGEGVNPKLRIRNVPEGAQSLVLVMDDPDIPESAKEARGIAKWDHWALYNIPPDTTVINEGEVVGAVGLNTPGDAEYQGPCPPDGEHRYIFRLYALPGSLNFIQTPTLDEIEAAARGSALESTQLTGLYSR